LGLASFVGGGSLMYFGVIGNDFFPSGDQSEIDISLQMPPATTLAATDRVASRLEADLRALPEVRGVFTTVTGHRAQGAALMVAPRERARSAAQLGEDLRRGWQGRFPGADVRIAMPNAFGFSGFGGGAVP